MTSAASENRRRTQSERSAETQRLLLEATIDGLIEHGYNALTTTEIANRAGVTRGAQIHHYPKKADLVQAAIVHLSGIARRDILNETDKVGGDTARVDQALEVLWHSCQGRFFWATMELTLAARTDPSLLPALKVTQKEIERNMFEFCNRAFGEDSFSQPAMREAVSLSIQFMTGLAFGGISRGKRWQNRLLKAWIETVRPAFVEALNG